MSQQQGHSGSLATVLALLAILSVLLVHFVWTGRWDEQVRRQLEGHLAACWPKLKVNIRSARHLPGKGFEIRGLRLQPPQREEEECSHLVFDEIFIACSNRLPELLANRVEIRSVECRRPLIHIVADQNGTLRADDWYPVTGALQAPFPIHVQQGVIEIVDRQMTPVRSLQLRELEGWMRPSTVPGSPQVVWQFEASLAGDFLSRGTAAGRVLAPDHWNVQIALTDIVLSPPLWNCLPSVLTPWRRSLQSLQATCGMTVQAGQQPDGKPAAYQLRGQFRQGRLVDSRLDHPLTDIQGHYEVDRQRVVVQSLMARYGSAIVEGSAQLQAGSAMNGSHVQGVIRGLMLSESLQRLLPSQLADAYQAFRPEGAVDISCQFTHDGVQWIPSGEVHCRHAGFAWRKFPLPVEAVVGQLRYHHDRLLIDVTGTCTNRPVSIRGDLMHPGKEWVGWCEYKTHQPMPLDDRLLGALPPRFQRGLRTLAPRGSFQISGRATRQHAEEKVAFHSLIDIESGAVQPASFPYLFQDLRGRVEQQGHHWIIHELVGRNDSASFRARGDWRVLDPEGIALQLHLTAENVPFEDELRKAISPSAQLLWRQLSPQGVLDGVDVTYSLDTSSSGKKLQIVFNSRAESEDTQSGDCVSLQPRSFPYRLDDVTGRVSYLDGQIQLADVRARHGRVLFATNGTAAIAPAGQWDLDLSELLADRCRPDREFLTALPARLRRVLEQLHATGEVCLRGRLQLHGQVDNPLQSRSAWDLSLDIADATAMAGVALRNISGEARVRGTADPWQYQCQGHLLLDSVMADRVHCTGVQGPLWVDQDRIVLGNGMSFGDQHESDRPARAPVRSVTATVFGGETTVDAEMVPARNGAFHVQARIKGMKLDQLSRDLAFARGPSRGSAHAQFRLEGDVRGTATWRGQGHLVIEDTDLYRLPVTLALLKQLRTGSRDRTAFDAAELAVRLQGQHLYFDQIDLHGDAVTLKGVGEMSLRRDLNLNFYTMMGREDAYLPAIRPFLGLASQRFLLVRVEGTLDQPVTSREILPAINETLEQLFPELATRPPASTASSIRTVSGP